MPLPDASTAATYGMPAGGFQNANPVRNAQTDQDATAASVHMVDTAALSRTGMRCWLLFTTAATTGALVLNDWEAMWRGVNPPIPAPTMARPSTGTFVLTWPTQVADELNTATPSHTISFRGCDPKAFGNAPYHVQPDLVVAGLPNVVTIYVWTITSGAYALSDAVGTKVFVPLW